MSLARLSDRILVRRSPNQGCPFVLWNQFYNLPGYQKSTQGFWSLLRQPSVCTVSTFPYALNHLCVSFATTTLEVLAILYNREVTARQTVNTCSEQMQYLIHVSAKGWLGNSQVEVIT